MDQNKKQNELYKKEIYNMLRRQAEENNNILQSNIIEEIQFSKKGCTVKFNIQHKHIKMFLNHDDYEEVPYEVLANGNFEKEELIMVKKVLSFLDKDSVIFDIGANVGWYTLHIKKEFSNMEIYSFEPSPLTYERLCNNMMLNDMSKEKCVNIGFFRKEGKLDFYYDPNGSGASSVVNLREKDSVKKIQVDMSTVDKWVGENNISKLDFIKCDVEGSELFVYQGGIETIKKYKPVVFSEMLRKWSAKLGYHPNNIIELFGMLGYRCFVISGDGYLEELLEVTEETLETNYFFLHRDKHMEIIKELADDNNKKQNEYQI